MHNANDVEPIYLNGGWVQSECKKTFKNIDPCTGEALAVYPSVSRREVNVACEIARKAFDIWRNVSRVQRAEILYKVAKLIEERFENLTRAISMETGKNYNESIAEVNEALHMAQYAFGSGRTPQGEAIASEITAKDSYMLRKPKGVIAIISPWNFPLAIGAFWCAAPALVEGNTVILKPSEELKTNKSVELPADNKQ